MSHFLVAFLAVLFLVGILSAEDAAREARVKERAALFQEALKLETAKKFAEAVPVLEKVLAVDRELHGLENEIPATTLGHLALMNQVKGDLPGAMKRWEELRDLRTKMHGADHYTVVDAKGHIRSLETWPKRSPQEKFQAAQAQRLHQQAKKLLDDGKASEAVKLARESVAIYAKIFGENWSVTIETMILLTRALHQSLALAEAETVGRRTIELSREEHGVKHPTYAIALRTLAHVCWKLDKRPESEALIQQSIDVLRVAYGDKHWLVSQGKYQLANYALASSEADRAEKIARELLANALQSHGENSLQYAEVLVLLGRILCEKKQLDEAITMTERSHASHVKHLGADHTQTLEVLSAVAIARGRKGEFAEVEKIWVRILELTEKRHGRENPATIDLRFNVSVVREFQGKFSEAEQIALEVVEDSRKVFGAGDPRTAFALLNYACVLYAKGDFEKARAPARESWMLTRKRFDAMADLLSERQQLLLRKKVNYELDMHLSLLAHVPFDPALDYAPVLAWKGTSFASQLRARQLRVEPELAPLAKELRAASERLASLILQVPEGDQAAARKVIEELSNEKEKLERELTQKSQRFRLGHSNSSITPEQLQILMPEGSVLIDFVEYDRAPIPAKGDPVLLEERRLAAFIIPAKGKIVHIELGLAAPIAEAIDKWRANAQRSRPIMGKEDSAEFLRTKIWQPLEKHIGSAKLILLSPDGVLNRLPFAALPGKDSSKYLIEEIALAVVPVPQMLPALLANEPEGEAGRMLLVGAVDFDAEVKDGEKSTRVAVRGANHGKWSALPATREEIAAIRDSFEQKYADGTVRLLRGTQANATTIRQQVGKHAYLHFATHGFFAAPSEKSAETGRSNPFSSERAGDHPGLLSGLVFAGANRPSATDHGVLTALEIAELDLRSVRLAVLSACETGLGKVASGEGVLGLQRAFQVAGARSVVSSLWKVDDEATRKLMSRFYENLWGKGLSKLEALREAQLWMLKESNIRGLVRDEPGEPAPKEKPRTPPYYWAAFVLSGDWR